MRRMQFWVLVAPLAALRLTQLPPLAAPKPAFDSAVATGVADDAKDLMKDQIADADSGAAAEDLLGSEAEGLPSTRKANDIEDVVEGTPTHTPTATHEDEDPAEELVGAFEDAIPEPPEPNMSARAELVPCSCDCCVAVERDKKTAATNWTCAPGVLLAKDELACDLTGITTCNAEEAFDYNLFCRTHCRAVATTISTQCMALSDEQLAGAKEGGVWTDPLVPAIEELPPGQRPTSKGGEVIEAPPTSSPNEQEDVAAQQAIVDELYGPDGPVQTAQVSLKNAQRVA